MIKKLLTILLLASICWTPACTTDFEIADDWKEITVVYGLIDQSQTTNYIRISKAFLSEELSALEMASTADSLYYNANLVAKLQEYDGSGNFRKDIGIERLNGEDVGLLKEEGIFANSPNTLYKTDYAFNEDYEYRLYIETPNGNLVTASTPIIDDFRVSFPKEETKLNFLFDVGVSWNPAQDGEIYSLAIHFKMEEERIENGERVRVPKTITWNLFSNFKKPDENFSSRINYDIDSEDFFRFIATSLDADDDVLLREFVRMDFEFGVGSSEFKRFNDVKLAQFGITSSQTVLTYSNIENGLGLFSTRYNKTVNNVKLEGTTLDELACGEITGHLKFAPDPNNPNYPFCF